MIRELPKSGANGATRWLTDRKAMIQMSLRHKWADIFWFTFFHEACHLLKHQNAATDRDRRTGPRPENGADRSGGRPVRKGFPDRARRMGRFLRSGLDCFTAESVNEFAEVGRHSPVRSRRAAAEGKTDRLQPAYRPETALRVVSLRGNPSYPLTDAPQQTEPSVNNALGNLLQGMLPSREVRLGAHPR